MALICGDNEIGDVESEDIVLYGHGRGTFIAAKRNP
jgi:hypothetical protein